MMQLIGNATNSSRSTRLARKHFYIVVSRFELAARLRAIEFSAVQRHRINVYLIRGAVLRRSPCAAAVYRRPLVGNICIILRIDRNLGNLAAGGVMGMLLLRAYQIASPIIATVPPRMRMLFLAAFVNRIVQIESNGVSIALIVHAHDRRAVARDGLLRNGLRGEAGIALRRRAGLRAGSAGHGFGFRIGILIVIGVFQPVDDGVARIGIGRPDGVER